MRMAVQHLPMALLHNLQLSLLLPSQKQMLIATVVKMEVSPLLLLAEHQDTPILGQPVQRAQLFLH